MQRHLLESHDCILGGWEASLKCLSNDLKVDLSQGKGARAYIFYPITPKWPFPSKLKPDNEPQWVITTNADPSGNLPANDRRFGLSIPDFRSSARKKYKKHTNKKKKKIEDVTETLREWQVRKIQPDTGPIKVLKCRVNARWEDKSGTFNALTPTKKQNHPPGLQSCVHTKGQTG